MIRVFVHTGDADEVNVTWKTFQRNLTTGKWVYHGTPSPGQGRYSVVVPEKTRGVHNSAGRTMQVNIILSPEESRETQEREATERLAYAKSLRERQKSNDAKWTGTYSAIVKGKSKSISATVEAPDAYVAGDKLRAKFEKEYGTDFTHPVAKFQGGPKRLDPSSSSRSIAMEAGPEED